MRDACGALRRTTYHVLQGAAWRALSFVLKSQPSALRLHLVVCGLALALLMGTGARQPDSRALCGSAIHTAAVYWGIVGRLELHIL